MFNTKFWHCHSENSEWKMSFAQQRIYRQQRIYYWLYYGLCSFFAFFCMSLMIQTGSWQCWAWLFKNLKRVNSTHQFCEFCSRKLLQLLKNCCGTGHGSHIFQEWRVYLEILFVQGNTTSASQKTVRIKESEKVSQCFEIKPVIKIH